MHGLGNDFVVIDNRPNSPNFANCVLDADKLKFIGNRKFGVGCDQVVVLENSKDADVGVRFFNSDGSESSACGNATRCVALLITAEMGKKNLVIQSSAGILLAELVGENSVRVNMGKPDFNWRNIPLSKDVDTMNVEIPEAGLGSAVALSVGNPHCVFFVKDTDNAPVAVVGPLVEHHQLFPQRVNVGFAKVITDAEISLRVWERGSGETEACGTGAVAAVAAGIARGILSSQALVHLPGGDLTIHQPDKVGDIFMTGSAVMVYKGEIDL